MYVSPTFHYNGYTLIIQYSEKDFFFCNIWYIPEFLKVFSRGKYTVKNYTKTKLNRTRDKISNTAHNDYVHVSRMYAQTNNGTR